MPFSVSFATLGYILDASNSQRKNSITTSQMMPIHFFCNSRVSSSLPFVNTPNSQPDIFNSLSSNTPLTPCHICNKNIHHKRQTIKCNFGKHNLHLKCAKLTKPNHVNRALWSCNDSLPFPFQDLNNSQVTAEVSCCKNNKDRKAKIALNNVLMNLNKNLPQLLLPGITLETLEKTR